MKIRKDGDTYIFPYKKSDLTIRLCPTANAWWKDPIKVYLLLDAFDNHCTPTDEACYVAGITRKQYKYFAQKHPVIYERRRVAKFAKRKKEIIRKQTELERKMLQGGVRAASRYLIYSQPGIYDRRYKPTYKRLLRIHGLPAYPPPPKTEEEKEKERVEQVEKTRIMLGHPSDPKHYGKCHQCYHLLGYNATFVEPGPPERTYSWERNYENGLQ